MENTSIQPVSNPKLTSVKCEYTHGINTQNVMATLMAKHRYFHFPFAGGWWFLPEFYLRNQCPLTTTQILRHVHGSTRTHSHDDQHSRHNANISAGPFCLAQWKSQEYFVSGFPDHTVYFDEFVITVVMVAAVAPRFMVIFILTRSDDENTHRRLGGAASDG